MLTEGKWLSKRVAHKEKRDHLFSHVDVICGGVRIAVVSGIGEENALANAEVIAAAPEMADVLIELFECLTSKDSTTPEENILLARIESIIHNIKL